MILKVMMNSFRYIFLGFLLTFASSWIGLVILPTFYYGKKTAELPKVTMTPQMELVLRGEQVYAANGCVYCHSQQVRPVNFGNDNLRGWGTRRSVAEDYMGDKHAFLGTMRTGPDLSNIGQRMSSAQWHFQHLYEPTSTSRDSIMPAYRFLFERKPVVDGKPDPQAITPLRAIRKSEPPDVQWVPTEDGKALVAYLVSLKRTVKERPEAMEAPIR